MKKLLFACVIIACALLTSCATIFDDDTSSVVINSDPTGAVIKVDGYEMGTTPATLNLDSGSSHTVEISKDGYKTSTVTLQKSIKWGWQVLDLFTTGLIGNAVDLLNPNGYALKPDQIYMTLTEL